MLNDVATPTSPMVTPHSRNRGRLVWMIVIALMAAVAAIVFMAVRERPAPTVTDQSPSEAPPSPTPTTAEPAAKIAPTPAEAPAAVPPLEQSDALLRQAIVDGAGEAGMRLLQDSDIVRRIVASIDNLTAPKVPRSIWMLKPVPGRFAVDQTPAGLAISASNESRYRPYVQLVTTLGVPAVATLYRRYADWFESTYRMLGYPDGGFKDRLLATIDDLLEAPQPPHPVALVQPKVLYQFADPELERLSAGQKMMIRMGPHNRALVEPKLRELRRELARDTAPPSNAPERSGIAR